MILLCIYIPESHLETVKEALFAAGGGKYGNYDRSAWQVRGEGQFRPLPGSNPFIGSMGKTESVTEYRVEMILAKKDMGKIRDAIKKSHPYEEPAWHFTEIITR